MSRVTVKDTRLFCPAAQRQRNVGKSATTTQGFSEVIKQMVRLQRQHSAYYYCQFLAQHAYKEEHTQDKMVSWLPGCESRPSSQYPVIRNSVEKDKWLGCGKMSEFRTSGAIISKTRSIWKMLRPFATASRRYIASHQVLLVARQL